MKKLFLFLLVVGGVVVAVSVYLYTKDYGSYFHAKKGTLGSTTTTEAGGDSLFTKSWLTQMNDQGFAVNCGMLVPKKGSGPYPAIIVLGGKATGKYAVDYAINIKEVIVVAVDYPYEARPSYTLLQFAQDVPAIRTALLDMVPSVMLLTDYLWQRKDVDTTKVVLLGYSFGAPLVPAVLAHDKRAAVAALVYGGGDLRSLITHNVRRYEGYLTSEAVGLLGGLLLRPLEPLRYIGSVTPKPLIMINGLQDEQIPRRNARILYDAASEPKKLIWLESMHVRTENVELTRKIVGTLTRELAAIGILDSMTLPTIPIQDGRE